MATRTQLQSAASTTAFGATLFGVTVVVAAFLIVAAIQERGQSGPATGSPVELIAEKERGLSAAESSGPSRFERFKNNAPDIGAASHPGLLLGLGVFAVGAAYMGVFLRRPAARAGAGASLVRGAAAVEAILLMVIGPLLAAISTFGIGGA